MKLRTDLTAVILPIFLTTSLAQAQTTKTAKASPTPAPVKRSITRPTPPPTPKPAPGVEEEKSSATTETPQNIETISPSATPPPNGEAPTVAAGEKKYTKSEKGLTVTYAFSPFGIAIPFKHGPSLAWRQTTKWQYELNYFSGSFKLSLPFLDIGEIKESIISLNARRYIGQSFNFIMGLSQQSYDASLGNDILKSTAGVPKIDLVKIRTLGVQLGMGNRWQWDSGWVFGIDWLVLNFPFYTLESSVPAFDYINNQDDRSHLETGVRFMRYFPTFASAKIAAGYTF